MKLGLSYLETRTTACFWCLAADSHAATFIFAYSTKYTMDLCSATADPRLCARVKMFRG